MSSYTDSKMLNDLDRYEDPIHFLPILVMGILLFIVVRRAVADTGIFGESSNLGAFCIVALALYGFDEATVDMILLQYAAMGAAILIAIASLVRKRATKDLLDD